MRVPAVVVAGCLVLAACGGASQPAAPTTYTDPQAAAAALGFGHTAVFDLLGEAGGDAYVEVTDGGQYTVVHLTRQGSGWAPDPATTEMDQPVATGTIRDGGVDWEALQAAADAGQPTWRTDPLAVARIEGLRHGLHADGQWGELVGEDDGAWVEVQQAGGRYRVDLVQPARVGPGSVWTVSDIEPHGGVAQRSARFQVASPRIGQPATSPLRVSGRAAVSDFWVELEDGHNVLAHQTVTVAADGEFAITLPYTAPTSPHGTLIFGVRSGAERDEDLMIPLVFDYSRSISQALRSPSSASVIWWPIGYSW